jgi:PAS domain S-box-containing protein
VIGPKAAESASTDIAVGRAAIRQALGALSTLLPIGIFAAEPDGSCWYLNQRLIDALGLEIRTGDERPLRLDLAPGGVPAQDTARLRGIVTAEGDDGEAVPTEVTLDARVMPVIARDGQVTSFIGIVVNADEPGSQALALHTSERLADTIMERSPEVITVLNPDGTWRYSNPAAWRLLGYQADFDPVNGILTLVHPDDFADAARGVERLSRGEIVGSEPFEIRVRSKDGSWLYMESTIEDLVDDPVIRGYLLHSRDVTKERQARLALLEANERLSTLVASLHLAVLVEDENRHIAFTNDAFVNLFEVNATAEQLAGRTIAEIGPEFFRRFGDPTWTPDPERTAEILRDRRAIVGDRLSLPDNRVLERDYLPIKVNGEYRGHVWLFRDVSGQAQAETEWQSLLSRQRHENERLVELDQVKAAFLAEISHELRTPLTSILSFAELINEGLGRDEVAEQAEFLEIIQRNADRLLRLVDDLLLLDRIETGAMPLEWGVVDVASLVSSCVSSFAPAAEAKSISLESEIGEGPAIPGDQGRLAQVVDVLLSNAIKFTPEGGRVIVSASPVDRLWRVEVMDNGIGVPAKEQASLFERFYRASNARASRIPGSGLGLSVARAITQLHGGAITLRSAQNGGTTASVTLPVEAPGDDGARAGDPRKPHA